MELKERLRQFFETITYLLCAMQTSRGKPEHQIRGLLLVPRFHTSAGADKPRRKKPASFEAGRTLSGDMRNISTLIVPIE
jgi:hypothetical protein